MYRGPVITAGLCKAQGLPVITVSLNQINGSVFSAIHPPYSAVDPASREMVRRIVNIFGL